MSTSTNSCPSCNTEYTLDVAFIGKTVRCSQCGEHFVVTGQEEQVTDEAEANSTLLADGHDGDYMTRAADFDVNTSAETLKADVPKLISPEEMSPRKPAQPIADNPSPLIDGEVTPPSTFPPETDESFRTWRVGEVLMGVYEVRPINDSLAIAEGGMGLVYRVYHRDWNLDLAVKSPKAVAIQSENGKQSFEHECQTWIELGMHPNIVTCYLVRRINSVPRVFAEFVEDGSLRDWIHDKRLYEGGPEKALARIIDVSIQFAWGLVHAHRHGVIHLDVKPGNVMLQGEVAKVTDFGLAQAAQAHAYSVKRRGRLLASDDRSEAEPDPGVAWQGMTPAYCSPEQHEASTQHKSGTTHEERTRLTKSTDVWSWALSVLTMFHGKPPCRQGGQTAHKVFEVFLKHKSDDPARPPMPPAIIALMRRCFTVAPEDRPSDLAVLADELIEIYQDVVGKEYLRPKPVDAELTADSLNNRAVSMLDIEKYEEAQAFFEEAWTLRPWHPRVTYNRSMLAWRQGRITDLEAIAQLKELGKTHPKDSDSFYALALAQIERGDLQAAFKLLEHAEERATKVLKKASPDVKRAAENRLEEISLAERKTLPLVNRSPRCLVSFSTTGSNEPGGFPVVFVSEDGDMLLYQTAPRTFSMRSTASGREVRIFHRSEGVGNESCLSEDLQWEIRPGVSLSDLELYEAGSGQLKMRFHPVSWGDSGVLDSDTTHKHLLMQKEGVIVLGAGEEDSSPTALKGHASLALAARFSNDGRWVVSGSNDLTIRVWEVATGRCIRTFRGHTHPVRGVYLTPNGARLLSLSGNNGLRLWDTQLLCSPKKPLRVPMLLSRVVSTEETVRTRNEFEDYLKNAKDAAAVEKYDETLQWIRKMRELEGFETYRKSFSPWKLAGRFSVKSESIGAWCSQTYDGDGGEVRSAALSDDARLIVSGGWDGCIRLWHAPTGRCLREFKGHTDWVRSIVLTPDDRKVVSAGWDKTIRVWDVSTGECLHVLTGHTKQIESVRLALEGRIAVSVGWDGFVRLWNLTEGVAVRSIEAHSGRINDVAITKDGRTILSCGEDDHVKVLNTSDGSIQATFEANQKGVTAGAVREDGRWAVTAGNSGSLKVWDLVKRKLHAELLGHTSAVVAVCFSTDGEWILSGSRDRTIRLWNLSTLECRRTMRGHADTVTSLAISRDTRWALSASADETVRLWEFDWDYEFPGWKDWDDKARTYLEMFLAAHRDPFGDAPPRWTSKDFEDLLEDLSFRGLGYIRAEGILKRLKAMASGVGDP
jgi:WD40 repeat protein/serine/threonine protein kinase